MMDLIKKYWWVIAGIAALFMFMKPARRRIKRHRTRSKYAPLRRVARRRSTGGKGRRQPPGRFKTWSAWSKHMRRLRRSRKK